MALEFTTIPVDLLLKMILEEEKSGQIFGIPKDLFFIPGTEDNFTMERYGQHLETPLGVAAGPHTQMAQNIISAWLSGARYIELKTVQTLDELEIPRPCIDIEDEGYNCEWSQELKLDDSYHEYLNAWIIIHILRHKLGIQTEGTKGPGVIFNLSVGYNLEGILEDNVQLFLKRMNDCKADLDEKIELLAPLYPEIRDIEISPQMSDNITLSTMHGCPPEEIEKIGMYLIKERKYNTAIKLNPTLLGPVELRRILNDELGFDTNVPDEAFGHDLKYGDALSIIKNLTEAAKEAGVAFGLKLTNTLESVNHRSVFPAGTDMMYMSGRALHPISINVAAKLQKEFNGALDISFCAGTDCFNLEDIIACGMKPVTICSDILKPGGYGRMLQYLNNLKAAIAEKGKKCIACYIVQTAKDCGGKDVDDPQTAALHTLTLYADEVREDIHYMKKDKKSETIKNNRTLSYFDCIYAPCVDQCPTSQNIPAYMRHVAAGNVDKAIEVIMDTNPFPNVLGQVCDHTCTLKCTRLNYDNSLLIREIKRYAAEKVGQYTTGLKKQELNGKSVAVVGAGPSGLSCAFYLALNGFKVDVFESKPFAGGMVSDAIPEFRLQDGAIEKDIEFIKQAGVHISYDYHVGKNEFDMFKSTYDYIYVGAGAQKAKRLGLEGEDKEGIIDCLSFLADVRRGKNVDLGKNVAIIGGGNSAMDAARTAWRLVGKEGKVTVVYRRSQKEMPADVDEIQALLEEGIELMELTAPKHIDVVDGKVSAMTFVKMKLGDKDVSGRARPVPVEGSDFSLKFDTIIPAIGQDTVVEFFEGNWIKVNEATGETEIENVFAGGDAARGASTVVWAVADGRVSAAHILAKSKGVTVADKGAQVSIDKKDYLDRIVKKSVRNYGIDIPEEEVKTRCNFELVHPVLSDEEAQMEAARCLDCDQLCSVCVTVCPNRANYTVFVEKGTWPVAEVTVGDTGKTTSRDCCAITIEQEPQIVNIGNFCNGCGNCTTFCPSSGAPFRDKPTVFLNEEGLNDEEEGYFLEGDTLKGKLPEKDAKIFGRSVVTLTKDGNRFIFVSEAISCTLDEELNLVSVEKCSGEKGSRLCLKPVTEMAIIYKAVSAEPIFN